MTDPRTRDEIAVLSKQIEFLDEEIKVLRRRLHDARKAEDLLKAKLAQTESTLAEASDQDERLTATLIEARDQIVALAEENDRLSYGTRARSGIFVTHGHDERLKLEVARLLESVTDEEVTILAERPNRGQTVIEKLEQYAGVRFAVVLMTPDDLALADGDRGAGGRARQNVVFELGLFLGLLGRNNVCALHKPGIEIPSDYGGVLLIEADQRGAWKVDLLRELQAAGVPVDWQRIR